MRVSAFKRRRVGAWRSAAAASAHGRERRVQEAQGARQSSPPAPPPAMLFRISLAMVVLQGARWEGGGVRAVGAGDSLPSLFKHECGRRAGLHHVHLCAARNRCSSGTHTLRSCTAAGRWVGMRERGVTVAHTRSTSHLQPCPLQQHKRGTAGCHHMRLGVVKPLQVRRVSIAQSRQPTRVWRATRHVPHGGAPAASSPARTRRPQAQPAGAPHLHPSAAAVGPPGVGGVPGLAGVHGWPWQRTQARSPGGAE